MITIAVELNINGNADEIQSFYEDFKESQNNPSNIFYPLNCNDNLMFDIDTDWSLVRFNAVCAPSKEWLDNLRRQYPSFKVTVFWHNICEVGRLGFIEEDGTEYEVGHLDDLKEAVKLFAQQHPPSMPAVVDASTFTNIPVISGVKNTPSPSSPIPNEVGKIQVTQLCSMYHEKNHDLLIKQDGRLSEYVCSPSVRWPCCSALASLPGPGRGPGRTSPPRQPTTPPPHHPSPRPLCPAVSRGRSANASARLNVLSRPRGRSALRALRPARQSVRQR